MGEEEGEEEHHQEEGVEVEEVGAEEAHHPQKEEEVAEAERGVGVAQHFRLAVAEREERLVLNAAVVGGREVAELQPLQKEVGVTEDVACEVAGAPVRAEVRERGVGEAREAHPEAVVVQVAHRHCRNGRVSWIAMAVAVVSSSLLELQLPDGSARSP